MNRSEKRREARRLATKYAVPLPLALKAVETGVHAAAERLAKDSKAFVAAVNVLTIPKPPAKRTLADLWEIQ